MSACRSWTCPQPAEPGSELCLHHKTAQEQDERDREVIDRALRLIEARELVVEAAKAWDREAKAPGKAQGDWDRFYEAEGALVRAIDALLALERQGKAEEGAGG